MHLEERPGITTAMEKTTTDATTIGYGSTGIYLNFANMSFEEIQRRLDNFSQEQPENLDILQDQKWRIATVVIYSIVILFGFLENMVIVFVLIKHQHLHVPTNIFILGLAASDILLCVFNLPFQLHYQLTNQWAFGKALCKVVMPTYGIPVFVSTMSILMIAIDRYILIVHPFRKRMTSQMAVGLVVSIATLAVVLTVPLIVQMEYTVIDFPELKIYQTYCSEMWTSLKLRHAYTVSILVVQYFMPLIVTSFLYIRIGNVLTRRPIKKKEKRHKHKTNKILIAIVLFYAICWTPWTMLALMLEFYPNIIPGSHIKLFDLLLKIFAMGSACINPFMYGWLNDNFRKEFNILMRRQSRSRVRTNGNTYNLAEHSRIEPVFDANKCPASIV
ncbi:neuropeptide F receptor-like [Mya arenaria]|uniref:neuropeptide F receptor-like n=1 Tax=Mya arenaria TaxID=6604 RepID=UPI0022E97FCE|nr:neuropeptide F receptor-like [Mya arenaria]XP_052766547.1 neuropeptide F receptor-like [Mya arenaria]